MANHASVEHESIMEIRGGAPTGSRTEPLVMEQGAKPPEARKLWPFDIQQKWQTASFFTREYVKLQKQVNTL